MEDVATDEGQESGGKLRDLAMAWRSKAVEAVIKQNPLLKASDFDGVEPDQIDAHAAKTATTRKSEADELLRQALVERGVAVDGDLDTALKTLTGKEPEVVNKEQSPRIASVGSLGGTPVKPRQEVPESAKGKILAGLAAQGN